MLFQHLPFKRFNAKDGIITARFIVSVVNLDEAGFVIVNIETSAATATTKNTAAGCNNIGVNCTLTIRAENRHNCL